MQPDGNVQACYAGDYNYATAFGGNHYATWTDGRVAVSSNPQQDVFFASVPGGPDFSVSLNPSSLTILQGGNGTSTTTVASTGGFSDAVTLACSGQPAGVACAFAPNPVTPPPDGSATSALTVGVGAGVTEGNYSFNVQGTSGALTGTATLNLQVRRQITVQTPNGAEIWPIGTNQQITWTASGSAKLKIDLSRNGGTDWESLFSSVANNARKTWKVTGLATTQALIRVCDLDGLNCDTSNANFTIQ